MEEEETIFKPKSTIIVSMQRTTICHCSDSWTCKFREIKSFLWKESNQKNEQTIWWTLINNIVVKLIVVFGKTGLKNWWKMVPFSHQTYVSVVNKKTGVWTSKLELHFMLITKKSRHCHSQIFTLLASKKNLAKSF